MKKLENYCGDCDRFIRTHDGECQEHGWYCPTLDEGTLVRNTAKKVQEIIEILDKHFN